MTQLNFSFISETFLLYLSLFKNMSKNVEKIPILAKKSVPFFIIYRKKKMDEKLFAIANQYLFKNVCCEHIKQN